MTFYAGRYDIRSQAVYVAKSNGAVWDYKVIQKANEEPLYLVATELISGRRIHNGIIKTDLYLTEAEEILERESENFRLD